MLREISGSRRGSIRSRVPKAFVQVLHGHGLRLILIPRTHLLETALQPGPEPPRSAELPACRLSRALALSTCFCKCTHSAHRCLRNSLQIGANSRIAGRRSLMNANQCRLESRKPEAG